MPRAAKSEGVTIGFLGTGDMNVDVATDSLEEFINNSVKPDEPARFIFPLTTDEFSDTMQGLALMAKESKIAYEVISHSDDKGRRAHNEVASSATKQYTVVDIWTQMEAILVEASNAVLAVLWDEKRDAELDEIAGKFLDAGIEVRDLAHGMIVLGKDESQEGEGPDEADEEAEDEAEEADDDEEEEDEAEEVAEVLYTRPAMEHMSHSEVKDIALSMGLPVRKARENMIVAILEKQGGAQAVPASSVRSVAVPATTAAPAFDWDGMRQVLDNFGERFFTGLEEFSSNFISRLEGTQFNLTPEEPMPVDEPEPAPAPMRRRLARQG